MKQQWHKFISREGVDATTISGLDVVFYDCIRQLDKKIKEPFFTLLQDRVLTHYLCVDPHEVGRTIYRKCFSSPAKVKKYYQDGQKFLSEVKRTTATWQKQIQSEDFRWQLQSFQVFRKQFQYVNYHFSIWPWWGIEAWQVDFEKMLNALIAKRNLHSQQDQIVASVYKPWKKTAIITLQEKLKKNVPLEKLITEYQFLRSWSVVWFRPIDSDWIKSIQSESKKGNEMELLSLTQLYKLLNPNQKEKKFIDLAGYISYFKDWRDDVRRTHVYSWSFLFDSMAKRFHVERSDLGYLSFDEIEQALLKNVFPKDKVEYRKKNPIIITTKDGSLAMTIKDKKIQKYSNIIHQVEAVKQEQIQVKGLVAQTGKVTGIVKIVHTYHDIKRVKAGDVLIANTTHPNYLPAMQRAAAFVTNEGGVISHAAIVARELKKPCIVATKIATEVFKDGDVVEVDATVGVVKRI